MFDEQYFLTSDVSVIKGMQRVTVNNHINAGGLRPTVSEATHRGVQHRFCFEDLCRYEIFTRNLSKGMNKIDAALELGHLAFKEDQNFALMVEREDPSGKFTTTDMYLSKGYPIYRPKKNDIDIRVIPLKFFRDKVARLIEQAISSGTIPVRRIETLVEK